MKDQNWIIKVETRLMAIQKDVEYIKNRIPKCEKNEIKKSIKLYKWVITILFPAIGVILGAIITKL